MSAARSLTPLLTLLIIVAGILLVPAYGFARDAIVTPLDASGNPIGPPVTVEPLSADLLTGKQIAFIHKFTILSAIFFSLTIYFSIRGDDDVVYKCLDRKPTGAEAIARVRWVFSKLFASVTCGILLAALSGKFIVVDIFQAHFTKNTGALFGYVCIAISYLLISAIQSVIRRIQGREPRPIIDFTIFRHNLRQRSNPWKRPND